MRFSAVTLVLFWLATFAGAGFLKTYFRPVAGWNFFLVVVLVFVLEIVALTAFATVRTWR